MNTVSPLRLILAFAVLGAMLAGWRYFGAPMREPPGVVEATLPEPCREVAFEGGQFIACAVDPQIYRIVVGLRGSTGAPFGSLDAVSKEVAFAFAMNAGMYHEDKSPVGLHVEDSREIAPLNTADADGNFFMKPNGVFFVGRDGKPGVLDTGAYVAARPEAAFATQSGPMLVVDGALHPRFEPDGTSRHIRNGVGIDGQGRAVFAISRGPVSLGKFARLFRDALECSNALFFDGAISALHDGKRYVIGGAYPVGPVVAVVKR